METKTSTREHDANSSKLYLEDFQAMRDRVTELEDAAKLALAKKESERMAALSANSEQSIAYMQAEALRQIAYGIREGKVSTIVVPYDFKGIVNVGK